ncbi:MAG: hypothetical protein QE290_01395 [Acidovorax sp.]|uniref:hypothetical protein n=1 Tax=Acidovorax sp. TaxID=1872122 RepID=UPI00261742C9|nr:hypothetical protein [Acidovorax sp.]MDH4462677.1 hypothetical protein [Acidovorax sp.]
MQPDCNSPPRTTPSATPASRPLQWAAVLATALLTAACASRPAPAAPAPQPVQALPPVRTEAPPPLSPVPLPSTTPAESGNAAPDPVEQVLADSDRILRLPPAELAREITRLGDIEETTADTPLLLATALAQTRQPVDTARALGLVQRVLAQPASQALHPLARWMESRLLQQRRMEEQLERQTQQLRDAQRRIEQLNDRLEAVRAIERSLTTRPAPSTAPASAAPAVPAGPPRTGTP